MEEEVTINMLETVKQDIISITPDIFISKWIMECTPIIFNEDKKMFYDWKHKLATEIQVDPRDIIITGSASIGCSLNPNKNFKLFNEKSDIDVAIISNHYFDMAWHELRLIKYYKLDSSMRNAIEEHRSRLIYWGTIATDKILPILSFGRKWNEIVAVIKHEAPVDSRDINFRIYKDNKSFRDYQINSIKECRSIILGGS